MILTEQLDLQILTDFISIDKKLSHEVYEYLIEKYGYIQPMLFDTLLMVRWVAYCKKN